MKQQFNEKELRIIRHSIKVASRFLINKKEQEDFYKLLDKVKKIINKGG